MSCSMSLQNQLHQLDFWICHELRWTRTLKSNTAHLQWAPLPEFSTSFWPQQLTCHLLPTDEGPNNSDWSNMEIVSGLALLGRRSISLKILLKNETVQNQAVIVKEMLNFNYDFCIAKLCPSRLQTNAWVSSLSADHRSVLLLGKQDRTKDLAKSEVPTGAE